MPVEIGIQINPSQLADVKAKLSPKVYPRILASAINEAGRYGETQLSKAVRAEVPLKVEDVKKIIRRSKASATHLGSTIKISREPVSLKRYAPRQTRKGVSVKPRKKPIKGRKLRELIKHAFIGPGGHVFKRKGKERLPIKKLFGPTPIGVIAGVPGLLAQQEQNISAKLKDRIDSKVLAHLEGKAAFK